MCVKEGGWKRGERQGRHLVEGRATILETADVILLLKTREKKAVVGAELPLVFPLLTLVLLMLAPSISSSSSSSSSDSKLARSFAPWALISAAHASH